MQLLIINYHYLKFPGKKYLANRGIGLDIFEQQLKQLKKKYLPINFTDYQKLLEKKQSNNNKYVIATFDDGLKTEALRAVQVAKKLNFPLAFLICGQYLTKPQMLGVQKIHFLLKGILFE